MLECYGQIRSGFLKCQAAVREWSQGLQVSADTRCSILLHLISALLLRHRDSTNLGKRNGKVEMNNLSSTSAEQDDLLSDPQLSDSSASAIYKSQQARRRLARRATRVLSNLTPTRLRDIFTGASCEEELVVALEHCAETLVAHFRTVAQVYHIYCQLFTGGSNSINNVNRLAAGNLTNSRIHGLCLAGWIQLLLDSGQIPPLSEQEAEDIWQTASAPLGGPLDAGGFAEALVRVAWLQSYATGRPLNARFDDIIHSIHGRIITAHITDVRAGVVATQFHAACKVPEVYPY